jgi:hypothetical protein
MIDFSDGSDKVTSGRIRGRYGSRFLVWAKQTVSTVKPSFGQMIGARNTPVAMPGLEARLMPDVPAPSPYSVLPANLRCFPDCDSSGRMP